MNFHQLICTKLLCNLRGLVSGTSEMPEVEELVV